MSKQKKIRSKIRAALPGADESLIDRLVAKVEHDLRLTAREGLTLSNLGPLIKRIIMQEELIELGLK